MQVLRPDFRSQKDFSFFHFLKEEIVFGLDNFVTEIVYDKNTYIYQPPKVENYIYEIVSGAVKLGGGIQKKEMSILMTLYIQVTFLEI